MIRVIYLLFLREKRGVFINKLTFPARIMASLINILFYWYAAKAFVPNDVFFENPDQLTLFYYVMIGELTLFFAFDALLVFSHQTKQIINEGVLEPLLLTKTPLPLILFKLVFASLLISSLTFFFELGLLMIFFEFHFPIFSWLQAGLMQLLFFPVFVGMGLCASGLLIYFKRGNNFLGTGIGLLSILSGTYFPVDVFPGPLQKITVYLNPLYFLLSQTRLIFDGKQAEVKWIQVIPYTLIMAIVFIIVGVLLVNTAIKKLRKSGSPLILGT